MTRGRVPSAGEVVHHQGERMKRIVIAAALAIGLAGVAQAAEDGAALFKSKCAACHGQNAEGGKMAPVAIAGKPAAEVKKVITEGKGKMKPVKNVTDAEADAIAKAVSQMKKG
jgi:mono/diheme cytochrome c family protein